MRKFALITSLLAIAALPATAAYSQDAVLKLIKIATKNGKPVFNIVVGGTVLGTCYETDCASEVRKLAEQLVPTEADLNHSEDDEAAEKPKGKEGRH
ncbi:sugar/nucleoside kinase (ribokinase family) [Bradyrhizobium sp. AZCC 1678]|uniref:hypothetical protein n=1 Tax=Bradyrhizobium sp. AZCC 1678 TaxID=3117030 RepID=UPI002FF01569